MQLQHEVEGRLGDLMLNERGFVFDPNTGESYQLSASGLMVLRELQRGGGVAGVESLMLAEYEVDRLRMRADLDAFLWELQQLGWL